MKKILMLFLLLSITCFGYISIDPIAFDKRIDTEDGTQTYYISNITKNKLAYRIYVEPPSSGMDMSQWIDFYPRSLKVDTGEVGKLRLQIKAPKGTKEGEYTANLVIKEIEDVNQRKNNNSAVKIYTELKIEISGYVGDIEPEFKVKNVKVNKNGISGVIENTGKIRRSIELYLSDGKDEIYDIYVGTVRLMVNDTKNLSDFNKKHFKDKLNNSNRKYNQLKIIDKSTDKLIKSYKI